MLCLDTYLVLRIAMMACNTALFMTCKEIRGMTTIHDRILMAIEEKNLDPKNALMKAISAGAEIEIIQFILGRTSFDASSLEGPLKYACMHARYQVVELLLTAGADLSALNWAFKSSVLIMACMHGKYQVVDVLLKAGADMSARDYQALKYACSYGHYKVVDVLLKAGADVHAHDDRAFEIATAKGFTSIVKLLRDADSRARA